MRFALITDSPGVLPVQRQENAAGAQRKQEDVPDIGKPRGKNLCYG